MHKYLTMPTITPADALGKTVDTIAGVIPRNRVTKDAVLQLMMIYRKQALDASDAESAHRVLRCLAESQRVQTEQGNMQTDHKTEIDMQNANKQRVTTAQVD